MELWIATSNKGKLNEFRNLLMELPLELHTQNQIAVYSAPLENGDSFFENAKIKAKSLHSVKSDQWVIADDSGLEVEGLNNLPGIHSARYAGTNATDVANTQKVLKMLALKSPQNRKAKFQCVMVAYSPEGEEFIFKAELAGTISHAMKGTEGFGYDNIFIPEGSEQTLSELGQAFKNKVSHRAQAIKEFRELLTKKL